MNIKSHYLTDQEILSFWPREYSEPDRWFRNCKENCIKQKSLLDKVLPQEQINVPGKMRQPGSCQRLLKEPNIKGGTRRINENQINGSATGNRQFIKIKSLPEFYRIEQIDVLTKR